MTLHTVTTYQVTCDGTLATACDATHPGRPHPCPATLTTRTEPALYDALRAGHWQDSPGPTPQTRRHWCPAHAHQRPDDDPWGGTNPLGCCRTHTTPGGRPTHGGPDCRWPGP